ncbi:hypothetical protein [Streptomyces sp. KR55]|uniref:hypothetical protein n=1 Tax=Streptomyces sp. KR55 TaxID=3457425 RepID=UPI003FD235B1
MLQGVRPLDMSPGGDEDGGIPLPVDHKGPIRGCIRLAKEHMRQLLLTLDAGQLPVVVMGDAESPSR